MSEVIKPMERATSDKNPTDAPSPAPRTNERFVAGRPRPPLALGGWMGSLLADLGEDELPRT